MAILTRSQALAVCGSPLLRRLTAASMRCVTVSRNSFHKASGYRPIVS